MTDMTKSQKYAVVDLEATNPGRYANIIQVGIVLIENGRISASYATDVNPHEPLDDHIKQLTGLTDERLAAAPPFSQVAGEIYDLLKDAVFVAHNVRFDANLLAEQLFMEGFELRTPRVDTVELTQVFFPSLEKYNLSHLSKILSLDLEEAHTALADAYATAQLFLVLQEKIASLPRQVLEQMIFLVDSLLYETGLVIEQALPKSPLKAQGQYLEAGGLLVKASQVYPSERALSSDFQTNIDLLGLETRPRQVKFAEQICQALQHQVSFLQAQTGLGKTYAYLLSLLAQVRDKQVVVAVPTLVLQDQIMANEVNRLQNLFHINAVSLKSPRHYIDLGLFASSLKQRDRNRLVDRYKMQLLVWLLETETGDLDEIRQKQGQEAYFDSIRHDGRLLESDLYYDLDFVKRRQDELAHSRLVITNHAYLLARISDDKAFLENKLLVVDEGQRFFLALENFSRRSCQLTEQVAILQELQIKPFSILYQRLLERLQFECQELLDLASQAGVKRLKAKQLATIRQDLSECDLSDLDDFKEVLSPTYSEFWLDSKVKDGLLETYLHAARLDFLKASQLLSDTTQVFYISATLAISPDVSLASLLGYSDFAQFGLSDSPISNQAIWLDQSMPMITEVLEEDFWQECLERILALGQLDRPILVLFTSRQSMFQLSEQLDGLDISHLCQDKHGPSAHLKNRFDKGECQLLLACGAFWEGVDFAKQSQLIEVIPRLPFDHPEDYLVQKIYERLRSEGKNPFDAYSLPLVALRLKQALGRINRSNHQASAVLILDSRILYKSYGKVISQALTNQCELYCQPFEACLEQMRDFLDEANRELSK